jgi:hypothetical protein
MRKTISILAMAAAVLCSCDKNADCVPCEDQQETGTLAVSLLFDEGAQTKAVTSFTTSQTYEKQVNKVQIFVFDESGKINIYKDAGTTQSNISISTTTGKKTIWAVVNGPDLSEVASLAELEDTALDLAANSTTAATGFVMAGSTSCTVSASAATANISVSRLVARVALQKVTNQLPDGYGALTIDSVVLTNVAGNQNIAGDATPATWYNKMGRKDGATESSQIIDGETNKASCEALTFKSVKQEVAHGSNLNITTPYLFYSFPNSNTAGSTGWVNPFTARASRLVVTATIDGVKYYYPVTLSKKLERNKAYTVEITITGLGSTDPDKPIEKGGLTAAITVLDWVDGGSYEETL